MIKEVQGDILLSGADAVAHGIAPNDNFHQGLALSLRESWPAMYKDFRHYCHSRHPGPGGLWTWQGAGGVRIINLFTQEGAYDQGSKPGKARTSWVGHALKALRKEINELKVNSIALPRIATGVGGLDWDDVRPLVEEHLGDLDTTIYLYTTFRKGVKADE